MPRALLEALSFTAIAVEESAPCKAVALIICYSFTVFTIVLLEQSGPQRMISLHFGLHLQPKVWSKQP